MLPTKGVTSDTAGDFGHSNTSKVNKIVEGTMAVLFAHCPGIKSFPTVICERLYVQLVVSDKHVFLTALFAPHVFSLFCKKLEK